jgi:hypothetical protein
MKTIALSLDSLELLSSGLDVYVWRANRNSIGENEFVADVPTNALYRSKSGELLLKSSFKKDLVILNECI